MLLKTLHFTNSWHPTSGGIGTFYRALLETANNVGWHARLVVPSDANRYEATGPTTGIYPIRAPRAPFNPEYRILYPHTYLLSKGPIREILALERPDLVEICDKYTLPYLGGLLRVGGLRRKVGCPAVVALSCERGDENIAVYAGASSATRWFSRAYMKHLYFPLADHHIAVSRHVADELEDASRGHKVTRGVWIRGMGVDTVRFHPRLKSPTARSALCARVHASTGDALLLYAGRLAREKNLPLLLDLLTELRNGPATFKLLIAGGGAEQEAFLRQARDRHGEAVVHLGHIKDRDQLAGIMANVDVFLHPNPAEPYGIAPLEAMSAGAAVVAPDSGGILSYANNSNAWVVPATPRAFSGAVGDILANPQDRHARTSLGRATAERLSWSAACSAYLSLYQEIYARRHGTETSAFLADDASVLSPTRGPQEPAFYSTLGNWLGQEIHVNATAGKASGSRMRMNTP